MDNWTILLQTQTRSADCNRRRMNGFDEMAPTGDGVTDRCCLRCVCDCELDHISYQRVYSLFIFSHDFIRRHRPVVGTRGHRGQPAGHLGSSVLR